MTGMQVLFGATTFICIGGVFLAVGIARPWARHMPGSAWRGTYIGLAVAVALLATIVGVTLTLGSRTISPGTRSSRLNEFLQGIGAALGGFWWTAPVGFILVGLLAISGVAWLLRVPRRIPAAPSPSEVRWLVAKGVPTQRIEDQRGALTPDLQEAVILGALDARARELTRRSLDCTTRWRSHEGRALSRIARLAQQVGHSPTPAQARIPLGEMERLLALLDAGVTLHDVALYHLDPPAGADIPRT